MLNQPRSHEYIKCHVIIYKVTQHSIYGGQKIPCVSVWIPLPKLFLTAQALNPQFPPHVPIFEEEGSPHRLTSRYSAVSYAFAVKGFYALFWAFEVLSRLVRELFHGCTFHHWPVSALQRQISHLSTPPPNRLFVISQILGDTWPDPTRVSRRVGERTWERGWTCCFFWRSRCRHSSSLLWRLPTG